MPAGERGSFRDKNVEVTLSPDGRVQKVVAPPEHLPAVFAAIRQPVAEHHGGIAQRPVYAENLQDSQEVANLSPSGITKVADVVRRNRPTAPDAREDTAEPSSLDLAERRELEDAYKELRELEELRAKLAGAASANVVIKSPEKDPEGEVKVDPEDNAKVDAEDGAKVDPTTPRKNKGKSLESKIREKRENNWRGTRRRLAGWSLVCVAVYAVAPDYAGKGLDYVCENGPQPACVPGHTVFGGAKAIAEAVEDVKEGFTGR